MTRATKEVIDVMMIFLLATLLDSTGVIFTVVIIAIALLLARLYYNIQADEKEQDEYIERGYKSEDMQSLWEDDKRYKDL